MPPRFGETTRHIEIDHRETQRGRCRALVSFYHLYFLLLEASKASLLSKRHFPLHPISVSQGNCIIDYEFAVSSEAREDTYDDCEDTSSCTFSNFPLLFLPLLLIFAPLFPFSCALQWSCEGDRTGARSRSDWIGSQKKD